MQTNGYAYPGKELELFSHAVHWKKYWGRQIQPFVRGRVLEVGAGLGHTHLYLWNDRVTHWTQLEPDHEMYHSLKQSEKVKDLDIIHGTIHDIPQIAAYDCILYLDVLEHIAEHEKELKESFERLMPGGNLIILAPAHPLLMSAFDHAIGHQRRYTAESLKSVMPAGLQPLRLRLLDSAGLLASLANKYLLNQSVPGKHQILFWDRWLVPVSTISDKLLFYRCGKSILGIWQKPSAPR